MDHVKGTEQSVQLLFFSFLPVKQWLGMNMRQPVSGQTKGLSTPGSFSDSCRYLQYKSMSKMQWYFLSDPEAAQSPATSIWLDIGFGNVCGEMLKIWFYFQEKHLKCERNIIKVHDDIHYFFTWNIDETWFVLLIIFGLKLFIVITHKASFPCQNRKPKQITHYMILGCESKQWNQPRREMLQWKKIIITETQKTSSAVKYTSFQRFWNGKLFLIYCVCPNTTDLFCGKLFR